MLGLGCCRLPCRVAESGSTESSLKPLKQLASRDPSPLLHPRPARQSGIEGPASTQRGATRDDDSDSRYQDNSELNWNSPSRREVPLQGQRHKSQRQPDPTPLPHAHHNHCPTPHASRFVSAGVVTDVHPPCVCHVPSRIHQIVRSAHSPSR